MPKRKKAPRADGRHVLLEFDKAGAEWVVVAYESRDARMISVCEGKESPHLITGHLISRAPKDLIAREDKVCGHLTDPVELERVRRRELPDLFNDEYFVTRNMTIRQAGKRCNHGLNYMMKPQRFSETTEMELADSKKLVHLYTHSAYPGLPKWWSSIRAELLSNGRVLYNCFGRKVRLLDEWSDELLRKAVSFKPQSTVSDLVRRGMKLAYEDESPSFYKADLQANVYDSLLWRYPADWEPMARFAIKLANDYLNPALTAHGVEYRIRTELKMGLHWGSARKPGGMMEVEITPDVPTMRERLAKSWELLHDAERKAA